MADLTEGLQEPFRSNVRALIAESGGRVTITSGRRSTAKQAELRVRNGCPDVYRAPASSCRVATAIPGTSKHEVGLAVDFTNTDAVLSIVERLAGKYRIHRTVPSERWHYEPIDGGSAGGGSGGVAGVIEGVPVVGDAVSATRTVGRFFAVLMDGSTWVRLLEVAGGLVLVVVGLVIIGGPASLGAVT